MVVIELLDTRLQILLQCQYSPGGSQAELKCDFGVDKPVWHCRVQSARITWQLEQQEKVCQDPRVLAQDPHGNSQTPSNQMKHKEHGKWIKLPQESAGNNVCICMQVCSYMTFPHFSPPSLP